LRFNSAFKGALTRRQKGYCEKSEERVFLPF
jgi:hypothetical protein